MNKLPKIQAAIGLASSIGRELQKKIPEIAEEYRDGSFLSDIIAKHDICKNYEVTSDVARTALRYALSGYEGRHGYTGLIPQEDLKKLAREHNLLRKTKKVGIFSITDEERRENSARGAVSPMGCDYF